MTGGVVVNVPRNDAYSVILSEAKNPFLALEKGDSHHFPPQPAPLNEGGATAQGIRGKPGLPGKW
jgi:hypothetical protein